MTAGDLVSVSGSIGLAQVLSGRMLSARFGDLGTVSLDLRRKPGRCFGTISPGPGVRRFRAPRGAAHTLLGDRALIDL